MSGHLGGLDHRIPPSLLSLHPPLSLLCTPCSEPVSSLLPQYHCLLIQKNEPGLIRLKLFSFLSPGRELFLSHFTGNWISWSTLQKFLSFYTLILSSGKCTSEMLKEWAWVKTSYRPGSCVIEPKKLLWSLNRLKRQPWSHSGPS